MYGYSFTSDMTPIFQSWMPTNADINPISACDRWCILSLLILWCGVLEKAASSDIPQKENYGKNINIATCSVGVWIWFSWTLIGQKCWNRMDSSLSECFCQILDQVWCRTDIWYWNWTGPALLAWPLKNCSWRSVLAAAPAAGPCW